MSFHSTEEVLVLSLFQFLLAGFVFLVLCVALRRGLGQQGIPPRFRPLAVAFFLLSGHLLLETFDAYLEMARPDGAVHFPVLHVAVEWLETSALAFLIPAYLGGPRMGLLVLLPGVALLRPGGTAAVNVILLAALLLLRGAVGKSRDWFALSPVMAALGAMTCRLFRAEWVKDEARLSILWSTENVLILTSLTLFALVVEKRTQNLYVQVFVRLNLIFILIATSLVLVATQAERRQLLEFEERHLQDLAEYLRGHILYFRGQGRSAEEILASPEITRKIVSEFGKIPDLRVVRLFLEGRWMEMSIREDGVVDYALDHNQNAAAHPGTRIRYWRGQRVATLLTLPIFRNQQAVGRIELDESLRTIDAATGRQVRTIFISFTLLVLLSGLLISLTVRDASRTIQRQYNEIEQSQRQLLQAAKLASVGELVDGVAHEINNPAGIILARTDYMRAVAEQQGAPRELIEDLHVVRQQAQRISEIVRGLLAFSRPSALQARDVDLTEVLEQSLRLVAPRCRSVGVAVRKYYREAIPRIWADPDRLEQVFVNLLNNAIDAMPHGGELTVASGFHDGQRVFVAVSDTGAGIPEEHLPRIFDPFFTTKPAGKGTGLGLAISYGIVRDHRGEIRVESAAGRGSTFTVLLPIRGEP